MTTLLIPSAVARASSAASITSFFYFRRFLIIKRMYKHRFSPERLERIDRMIEAANATCYSKLANCVLDLKKQDTKDMKKKRGWTESEWKKHMDYISHIAAPKKDFRPPPLKVCFKIQQLIRFLLLSPISHVVLRHYLLHFKYGFRFLFFCTTQQVS